MRDHAPLDVTAREAPQRRGRGAIAALGSHALEFALREMRQSRIHGPEIQPVVEPEGSRAAERFDQNHRRIRRCIQEHDEQENAKSRYPFRAQLRS